MPLWQWIKHSARKQAVFLTETLHVGKINPYPDWASPVKSLFYDGNHPKILTCKSGSWLIALRNGAIMGTQCQSLLLADWSFSSGYQVSLAFVNGSLLLSPCIISHHGHFVFEPIGQYYKSLGKEADLYTQNGSPYKIDYQNPPLLKSHFGEHWHGIQISYFLTILRCVSTYFYPRPSCHLWLFFFQVINHPATPFGPNPRISMQLLIWLFSPCQ